MILSKFVVWAVGFTAVLLLVVAALPFVAFAVHELLGSLVHPQRRRLFVE